MRTATVLIILAGLVGPAWADLDDSNAYTDGGGVTWSGTKTLANDGLRADVEWLVNDRVLHGGELQFEYAYQLTIPAEATKAVLKFSVGMLDSNEAQDIGSYQIDVGDIAPSDAFFGGPPPDLDTANWTFGGDGLLAGDVTYALNYWSVNEPQWGLASLHDSGTIAGGILPSPSDEIPEPATLCLLAAGLIPALRRRR